MADAAGIKDALVERPDLEPALETVLDVDERHDTWTFEDLPLDSGTFGELVSRGLVEETGDGYRLADPAAVRTALAGAPAEPTDPAPRVSLPTGSLPAIDRTTAAIVAGALAFLAVVRSYPFPAIYRNGDVVLSGNDPYYYRYWVEQVLATSATPFDLGALDVLPVTVHEGEPLTVATLWWIAELLGSGPRAAGHVLAWYPVVSAVLTAGLLYLVAVHLTADRRVGVAAIFLLAILPGHALRTALGYADHHAFDYPWLVATALALVVLATVDRGTLRSRTAVLAGGGLGLAVTGQVLAWEAGPLLVAPIGAVVVGLALLDVRTGRSPLVTGTPVLAGIALAAVLTWLVHALAGWQSTVVAITPALLFVGVAAVLAAATLIHRTTADARHLASVVGVVAAGGLIGVRGLLPDLWATLTGDLARLVGDHDAVETVGLFDPSSMGFVTLMGLTLVLAVPTMAIGVRRSRDDARWLVATVYAWYLLGLAALQIRFVGELGAFAALFAGIGFVKLAAWVDLTDPVATEGAMDDAGSEGERLAPLRIPDRQTLGALFVLFLLFGAFGAMQTVIKTEQTTIDDATYETATAIEADATARDRGFPDNYVLSRWGHNRVYNYYVNGEADSYAYAEDTYVPFVSARDPDGWYDRLRDRVGYVVLEPTEDEQVPPETMQGRLFGAYGSRQSGGVGGLGHYQAISAHESGDRIAFALVPGANVTGTAPANATVTVSTTVSIPGASFTYTRQTAAAGGEFAIRVAYPGEYTVEVGDETRSVDVSDRAVETGGDIET